MCGRARLPNDYSEIKIRLKLSDEAPAPNLRPSWNIAPTQDILAVVKNGAGSGRIPKIMRWGLVPSWAKEIGPRPLFNARSETVATMPAFRGAWRAGRRCLVVTDGFYEWRQSDKQPFAIASAKGDLTILAGLWEIWRTSAGETVPSCTVLTTEANSLLASLHDRMPVILAEKDWPTWLGETPASEAELKTLLVPFPSEQMTLWPVGRRVGNVKNDDADLIQPVRTLL